MDHKKWKDFLKRKIQELKTKGALQEDFITTDFHRVDDSTLGGYIVRDGAYQYGDGVKYKTWDNLKQAYGSVDHYITYGSKKNDSHTEGDDRMVGYMDTFTMVPKGTEGPTEPKVDNKFNRVWAKWHTSKDIKELSDLKEIKNIPYSSSYQDLGEGEFQVVGKIHHGAVSLNATETDRCSTMGGTSCNLSIINDFNDQNQDNQDMHDTLQDEAEPNEVDPIENEEVQDFDKEQNGVLSVDCSPPPTNKKKSDETIGKKDKKDVEKEETKEDKEDTVTIDGNTSEISEELLVEMAATDDDDIESRITGDPNKEGSEKVNVRKTQKKDMVSMDVVKDLLEKQAKSFNAKLEQITKPFKEEKDMRDAEKLSNLQEVMVGEPYGFSEESIKDMTLEDLETQKKLQDSTSRVKDFYETQDMGYTIPKSVNTKLFDESSKNARNFVQDMINTNTSKYWAWADPDTNKDFFTEGN